MRPRPSSRVRAALAFFTLLVPAGGTAFTACSGGSSPIGAATDASEASAIDATSPVDVSAQQEAATPDTGTDATQGADAGVDVTAGDAAAGDGAAGDAAAEGSDGEAGDASSGYPDGSGFAGDCGIGVAGEPTELRCTGLYADWASKTVSPDMQVYDPGLHLWSDGADKTRWISLPAGQKIDTSDMDQWTFPVGTKIFKEFRLPLGDASTGTRIETRLLWKEAPGLWYRTTYRWSDDGVTSTSEMTGGQLDAGGTGYEVPSQLACNKCHNGRRDGVLGFEAVSLSSPGAAGVTLQTLAAQNLLTAPPATPIVIPGNATESAALGYLHANCGTACHNSDYGLAQLTGFYMRLDVATLATVQTTNTYTTGWGQPTQAFSIPDAATTYRLHACDLGASCVYYRASHRTGVAGTPSGVQMPPIDTHMVDDAGLGALAAWIEEGCDSGP